MIRPGVTAKDLGVVAKRWVQRLLAVDMAPVGQVVTGVLDEPVDGAVVDARVLYVSGWVDDPSEDDRVVVIRVDGKAMAVAAADSRRADVADALGRPELLFSGFRAFVEFPGVRAARSSVVSAEVAGKKPFATAEIQRAPDVEATVGGLDRPGADESVRADRIGAYGWALIGGRPAEMVHVLLDGEVVASVPVGTEREDVVAAFGTEEAKRSGFEVELDISRHLWERGEDAESVGLSFIASSSRSPYSLGLGSVLVRPDSRWRKPTGYLDRPARGVRLPRDYVTFHGWVLAYQDEIDRVELRFNDEFSEVARIGIDRLDLVDVFGQPDSLLGGFEVQVDLSRLPESSSSVRVEVVAVMGDETRAVALSQRHSLTERKSPFTAAQARKRASRAAVVRERSDALIGDFGDVSRAPLNLLAVTHHLGYGGGQLWLSEMLARCGAGRQFKCTVLAPNDGPLRTELERLGIEVHLDGTVPVDDIEAYEGRIAELSLWARSRGFNAAIVNTLTSFAGVDVAQRLDIPSVWAIHESWPPDAFWHAVYPGNQIDPDVRLRANWCLGRASAVVFEADATRCQFLDHVAADRAHVIRYGVRLQALRRFMESTSRAEARTRLRIPADERLLLVMGTIEPRKAQGLITQAFSSVLSANPKASLALVGDTKTPYSRALKMFIDACGLQDRVRVIPVVRDTYSWYRAADVLVCASDIESLPRTVLEAMYMSLPVVATNVFGLGEVLDDGKTAMLFEPKSRSALTKALHRAVTTSSSGLQEIAMRASELAERSYDSSGYAREILELLEESRATRRHSEGRDTAP